MALLSHFPAERYRLGSEVVAFGDSGTQVRVTLADGTTLRCDLLVCADGVASTARPLLLPGHEPRYAGYVGWRGVAPERDLSDSTRALMGDAINYRLLGDSHILTYPIPSYDGDVRPGRRLINFVWYRNVPAGPALDELLTDVHGDRRALSVPPGAVREQFVAELRQTAREALPPGDGRGRHEGRRALHPADLRSRGAEDGLRADRPAR